MLPPPPPLPHPRLRMAKNNLIPGGLVEKIGFQLFWKLFCFLFLSSKQLQATELQVRVDCNSNCPQIIA